MRIGIEKKKKKKTIAATASAWVKPILIPKKYHFKVLGGTWNGH